MTQRQPSIFSFQFFHYDSLLAIPVRRSVGVLQRLFLPPQTKPFLSALPSLSLYLTLVCVVLTFLHSSLVLQPLRVRQRESADMTTLPLPAYSLNLIGRQHTQPYKTHTHTQNNTTTITQHI